MIFSKVIFDDKECLFFPISWRKADKMEQPEFDAAEFCAQRKRELLELVTGNSPQALQSTQTFGLDCALDLAGTVVAM
ncbi:hypothetical protein [Nitrosomonas sp. Nm132]|uniref:hypothetical protein n=1 Tax=Nitrosomonas sp. Nm132 TaxID=1881053 RepID=UPI00115FBA0A|nr:hypothetical protein [Nitrosomonas sp. Nm132]